MNNETMFQFSKEDLIQELNSLIEPLGLDYETYEQLMIKIIKTIDELPESK